MDRAWDDLRARRRLILVAIFGYPIVSAVIVLGLSAVSPDAANAALPIAMVGWFLAAAGTNVYRMVFKCPRCHHRFFWSPLWVGNAWAGECLNCGLEKFAANAD